MELSKMPIWLAYLLGPALVLLFASWAIVRSDSPLLLCAIAVACGVLCAAALHAYVFVKRLLNSNKERIS